MVCERPLVETEHERKHDRSGFIGRPGIRSNYVNLAPFTSASTRRHMTPQRPYHYYNRMVWTNRLPSQAIEKGRARRCSLKLYSGALPCGAPVYLDTPGSQGARS